MQTISCWLAALLLQVGAQVLPSDPTLAARAGRAFAAAVPDPCCLPAWLCRIVCPETCCTACGGGPAAGACVTTCVPACSPAPACCAGPACAPSCSR